MYRIRKDRVNELKEGKTNVYLEKLTGYTKVYLSNVFRGATFIPKDTAEKIIRELATESIQLHERIEKSKNIEEVIEYFFKKDEEN